MNFQKADVVQDAIQDMVNANRIVDENRAKINELFNGEPPWTPEEHEENKGFVNVNFLEPSRIAHNARQQLNNAFTKLGHHYTATYDKGQDPAKRREYSEKVTYAANKVLKATSELSDLFEGLNTQTVLHGIGPCNWSDEHCPVPLEVAIGDVLMPKGTYTNLRNFGFGALRHRWTYSELYRMCMGKDVDPGWRQKACKGLLKALEDQRDLASQVLGTLNRPEDFVEDVKSGEYTGGGWAPSISVYEFFHQDYDAENEWHRCIVLDKEGTNATVDREIQFDEMNEFLFKSDTSYADDHRKFLHFQFGNCSNISPFRYHSVRSIGYLLFAVGAIQNMMRCRFADRIFAEMMEWFRNVPDADREKFDSINLYDKAVIPESVSFVTAQERYQVNFELVNLGLAQNRQLMAESSATFTPDVEKQGTQGGYQSATEAMIRMQTSTALNSAMLNQAYSRAKYLYAEIHRRLSLKGNKHPMAKRFVKLCLEDGVPEEVIHKMECWVIEPDRVLGGGNKSMEVLEANQLMTIRGQLDPQAQRDCTRKFITANTDDPKLALEWVPPEPEITDAAMIGSLAFGTLMQGSKPMLKRGLNEPDYIITLLKMMNEQVQGLEQLSQVPNMATVVLQKIGGLMTVSTHLEEHIKQLAQDEQAQELAKQFMEALTQLIQKAKPFREQAMKELQEQDQGQGQDPEQAKIQAMIIKAQAEAQIQDRKAKQKEQHRDFSFQAESRRRDAETMAGIQRDTTQHLQDMRKEEDQHQQELYTKQAQHAAEMEAKDLETQNDILLARREAIMSPPKPKPPSNGSKG